jgi:hypothetical protein
VCRNLENWKVRGKEKHWTEVMSSEVEDWRFRRPENYLKMRERAMDQRTEIRQIQ